MNILWNHGMVANDQQMLRDMLPGTDQSVLDVTGLKSAAIVTKGIVEDVNHLNMEIAKLDKCVLFVTSDEEGLFPIRRLQQPNLRVWQSMPRRGTVVDPERVLLVGYQPTTPKTTNGLADRPIDWMFAGQAPTERRRVAVSQMERLEGGMLLKTAGFMRGLPLSVYYDIMQQSKIALCPCGNEHQDSFRLTESLMMGCVPIVDGFSRNDFEPGYWEWFFKRPLPFPVIYDWSDIGVMVKTVLNNYEEYREACKEFWFDYTLQTFKRIGEDLQWLSE